MDTRSGLRFTVKVMTPAQRKRLVLWLGAASVLAAALGVLFPNPPPVATPKGAAAETVTGKPIDVRFASLPARDAIGPSHGELFGPRSWAPEPAPAAKTAVAQVAEKPSAPPLPYRFGGQVVQDDGVRVVLLKGERAYEVREGETLDDGYRLDSIQPRSLTFTYVPLGAKQELAISGPALELPAPRVAQAPAPRLAETPAPRVEPVAPSSAAQLRFEGPQQVRAGKPFDVALKITSQQPVRAMPMQLSFDAKRLEPVSVRAGELFAGGSFTYRVNPSGSIFVGASGSGRAAANTDSLIVTFRPIASGAAELKVSSLLVQGAAGRTIAHEPPQAFRAAVVQ
jgi:hypothetical protein